MEDAVVDTLTEWFRIHGRDDTVEIEARFKDVTVEDFEAVEKRLRTCPSWTSIAESTTLDIAYSGRLGIRETVEVETGVTKFVSKTRVQHPVDVDSGPPHFIPIRFSLTREVSQSGPPLDEVHRRHFRRKHRRSYVHKGTIAYDLTRVQSGDGKPDADGDPEWEIELEWCGQNSAVVDSPSRLAHNFLVKVDDIVGMIGGSRRKKSE